MNVAMSKKEAKEWFGATPLDLSVIARARGADWLYTYLRTFYRDETRPTGWNNLVFDKVGMPHILYQFQGEQVMQHAEGKGEHAGKLVLAKSGTLKPAEYDAMVEIWSTTWCSWASRSGRPARTWAGSFSHSWVSFSWCPTLYIKSTGKTSTRRVSNEAKEGQSCFPARLALPLPGPRTPRETKVGAGEVAMQRARERWLNVRYEWQKL